VAGRVGVAMVISWGGHSPSLTLTEKIMLPACLPACLPPCLPACLSTDVATNRRDIRSPGNKANVRACTKLYETDPVFESRDYEATSQRSCCSRTFRSSARILKTGLEREREREREREEDIANSFFDFCAVNPTFKSCRICFSPCFDPSISVSKSCLCLSLSVKRNSIGETSEGCIPG